MRSPASEAHSEGKERRPAMNLMINPNQTLAIAADHRQAMYAAADRHRLRRQLRAAGRNSRSGAAPAAARTAPLVLTVSPRGFECPSARVA